LTVRGGGREHRFKGKRRRVRKEIRAPQRRGGFSCSKKKRKSPDPEEKGGPDRHPSEDSLLSENEEGEKSSSSRGGKNTMYPLRPAPKEGKDRHQEREKKKKEAMCQKKIQGGGKGEAGWAKGIDFLYIEGERLARKRGCREEISRRFSKGKEDFFPENENRSEKKRRSAPASPKRAD